MSSPYVTDSDVRPCLWPCVALLACYVNAVIKNNANNFIVSCGRVTPTVASLIFGRSKILRCAWASSTRKENKWSKNRPYPKIVPPPSPRPIRDWFLGPTRVRIANGISIGSSVLAQLTVGSNRLRGIFALGGGYMRCSLKCVLPGI